MYYWFIPSLVIGMSILVCIYLILGLFGWWIVESQLQNLLQDRRLSETTSIPTDVDIFGNSLAIYLYVPRYEINWDWIWVNFRIKSQQSIIVESETSETESDSINNSEVDSVVSDTTDVKTSTQDNTIELLEHQIGDFLNDSEEQ